MASFDLTPLNKETIEKMGLHMHELWLIKIDQEVHGPFESHTLKEYAAQNETLFDEAMASKVDTQDFKPFWSHALFQRRSPQLISQANQHNGPFWVLDQGLKTGPFNKHEIDKKIEMGFLSMSDHVSTDNGHHWKKLFQFAEFDRRNHSVEELPKAPLEDELSGVKGELLEKLQNRSENSTDEFASLAHVVLQKEKSNLLKLEEIQFRQRKTPQVSKKTNWALPSAIAIIFTIVGASYLVLSPEAENDTVANVPTDRLNPKKLQNAPNPSMQMPRAQVPAARRPASIGPAAYAPRPSYTRPSRIHTRIETHHDANYDEPMEADPRDIPYDGEIDNGVVPEQEHSLITTSSPGIVEEQSLDAAMNGVEQPTEPVVEEASDF